MAMTLHRRLQMMMVPLAQNPRRPFLMTPHHRLMRPLSQNPRRPMLVGRLPVDLVMMKVVRNMLRTRAITQARRKRVVRNEQAKILNRTIAPVRLPERTTSLGYLVHCRQELGMRCDNCMTAEEYVMPFHMISRYARP